MVKVIIPSSVTFIGNLAFPDCKSVEEHELCTSLSEVKIEGE